MCCLQVSPEVGRGATQAARHGHLTIRSQGSQCHGAIVATEAKRAVRTQGRRRVVHIHHRAARIHLVRLNARQRLTPQRHRLSTGFTTQARVRRVAIHARASEVARDGSSHGKRHVMGSEHIGTDLGHCDAGAQAGYHPCPKQSQPHCLTPSCLGSPW